MPKTSAPRSRKSPPPRPEPPLEPPLETAAAPKADAGDELPPEVAPETLASIRKLHKAPTEIQRKAYRSQFSDEFCDGMGTKTRAELVLREVLGWVVALDDKKRKPNGSLIHYSGPRIIWMLDCAEQLRDELEQQKARAGDVLAIKSAAEQAEANARRLLQEIREVLEAVAEERKEEKNEYERKKTKTKAAEDVAARLAALSDLGQRWRRRKDEVFQVLIEEHGLTEDLVERGAQAAKRLQDSRPGARGNRRETKDTPSVNRIEGRVLAEMRVAMKAVARANRTDKTITLLVPGPGTRAALVGRTKKGDKKPPPDK